MKVYLLSVILVFGNCGDKKNTTSPEKDITAKKDSLSQEYTTGNIINTISAKKNAGINYSLYLPKKYNRQNKYPVLFFFDAHARGSKPLTLYSILADKYSFIFIGSNDSKNGLDNQSLSRIILSTINDVLERFSIDTAQIYTSGFSGGAKVASIAAYGSPQIKGVIACAAGMPEELVPRPFNFSYIGIVGLEDFNYNEMCMQEKEIKNNEHDLLFFRGKHEWPPVNTMEIAIRELLTFAMLEKRTTPSESFIISTKSLLKDSVLKINPSSDQLEKEKQLQKEYAQALTENDFSWWEKEIKTMNEKINTTNNEAYQYKRIKNYISMMCYMYVNRSIMQNQLQQAGYFVDIYELADPNNPDVFYFKGAIFSIIDNKSEALSALRKCADLGFDDPDKLNSETAFNNIRHEPQFEEIIEKVSMNPER